MQIETLIHFLIATAIVTAIPGPNILLIVNDSIQFGTKKGMLTVFGVSAGMIPLFILSIAGVSAFLVKMPMTFGIIRLAGIAYLTWLGAGMIWSFFRPAHKESQIAKSHNRFFLHGMFICMTNPKGLLFAGAFFPQFLNPADALFPQVFLLITGCLIVATAIGTIYAFSAGKAGSLFKSEKFNRWVGLTSGILLILFGVSFLFTTVLNRFKF